MSDWERQEPLGLQDQPTLLRYTEQSETRTSDSLSLTPARGLAAA